MDKRQDKRQDKKLDRLQQKSDKADSKLDKAKKKLPTRRKLRLVKIPDPDKGGVKRRLRLKKEVRPEGSRTIKGRVAGLVGKGLYAPVQYAHHKISQVEHENVGVEAAHKTEQLAERIVAGGGRFVARRVRSHPYRRVRKAEKKVVKAGSQYQYRKTVYDNPALQRDAVRRARMRRNIYKQHASAAKNTRNTTRTAAKAASHVGKSLSRFIARVVGPKRKAAAYLTIGIVAFMMLSACFSIVGTFAASIFGTVADSTYSASDTDIVGSSLEWTEWEYDLQEQIDNVESDYPGYDHYKYDLDEIGHNPYQIIAFLSALYDDFIYTDVSGALRDVFDEVYQLEFKKKGTTLIVSLTVQDFEKVVKPILKAEDGAWERYKTYMESLGGRQRYGNPLGFSWYGSITSLFGYRPNPFGGSKREYHNGLDIAAAEGHPISSVHSGTVVQAVHGDSIYGNYVIVEDDDNRKVKYAHCYALLVKVGDEVEKGDVIAKVGTTGRSSGNHVHIEIIENGVHLNPLFLLEYS